ncbi:hypothetical protein OF83DRAFT_1086153 [Amylostereum chailletii]|nr:hypothetical protein OF83DRAFT_1086153 [Amylostereum chailletii]
MYAPPTPDLKPPAHTIHRPAIVLPESPAPLSSQSVADRKSTDLFASAGDDSEVLETTNKKDKKQISHQATSSRKRRGTGSKSGAANQHDIGQSDEEIAGLTHAQADVARLKAHEVDVSGTDDVFTGLECNDGDTDIRYLQNHTFEKYKACRVEEEHTGGGDGDADRVDREAASGRKRKNAPAVVNLKGKKKKAAKERNTFSSAILKKFRATKIYEMIDAVAHNDDDVVRLFDVNSGDPIVISSSNEASTTEEDELPKKKNKPIQRGCQRARKDAREEIKFCEHRARARRDEQAEKWEHAQKWLESPSVIFQKEVHHAPYNP